MSRTSKNRVLYSLKKKKELFCLLFMWPEVMYFESLHVTILICNDWWYVHMQRRHSMSPRGALIDGPLNAHVTIQSCKGFVHLYMIVGKINRWTKTILVRPHLHSLSCLCSPSFFLFLCMALSTELELKKKELWGSDRTRQSDTPFPQVLAPPLPGFCFATIGPRKFQRVCHNRCSLVPWNIGTLDLRKSCCSTVPISPS